MVAENRSGVIPAKADAVLLRKRIDNLKKMVEDHEQCVVAMKRASIMLAQMQRNCQAVTQLNDFRQGISSPHADEEQKSDNDKESTPLDHSTALYPLIESTKTIVADDYSVTDDCSWYTLFSLGSARRTDNKMRGAKYEAKTKTKCRVDEGFSLHEIYESNVEKPGSLYGVRMGLYENDRVNSSIPDEFESNYRSPTTYRGTEKNGSKIANQLSEMTADDDSSEFTVADSAARVGQKTPLCKKEMEKRHRLVRLRQKSRSREKSADTYEDIQILQTCSSLTATSGLVSASTYLGSYNVVG